MPNERININTSVVDDLISYTWPTININDTVRPDIYKKIYSDISNKNEKDENGMITLANGKKCKEEDAIKIYGDWYHKDDKNIAIDYFTKDPLLKDHAIAFYTELGELSGKGEKKYTHSEARLITCINSRDNVFYFNGEDTLIDKGYVECLETGHFYHPSRKQLARLDKVGIYREGDFSKETPTLADKYKYGKESPTFTITEGKKYSFGVELETIIGRLPHRYDHLLNYTCERDGSLKNERGEVWGGEYVTGVLKGDLGFKHLKLITNSLSKYCKVNKQCGIHVHVGNMDFNKENIVYLYKLCLMLEKELFSTLPYSRRNNEYCKQLKNFSFSGLGKKVKAGKIEYKEYIEDKYNEILLWISTKPKLDPAIVNKKNNHPLGSKCGYNHSTARYCWLNLVPAMFNTRGNEVYTVEFRNHGGSLNYYKIRNWVLICMAIVHVVENHKQLISENNQLTLSEILMIAYPKKASELIDYIESRKKLFSDDDPNNDTCDYQDDKVNEETTIRSL